MRVCRGPQGPRPADAGGIQPVSGRLRRGKYTHRCFGATAPLRRLRRQGNSSAPKTDSAVTARWDRNAENVPEDGNFSAGASRSYAGAGIREITSDGLRVSVRSGFQLPTNIMDFTDK